MSAFNRRWFRFVLLTGFVLLTMFCIWLGVQAKWIHDRHKALESNIGLQGRLAGGAMTHGHYIAYYKRLKCDAPWSIRILGEPGMGTVFVGQLRESNHVFSPVDKNEVARLKALFPEADVREGAPTQIVSD